MCTIYKKALQNSVRLFSWSGKRGSDPRPQPWQGCALPTELFPHFNPVPCGWDCKGTEFFLKCKFFYDFFANLLLRVAKDRLSIYAVYDYSAILTYLTLKNLLCKLIYQLSLDQSLDRTCSIFGIISVLDHVILKGFCK